MQIRLVDSVDEEKAVIHCPVRWKKIPPCVGVACEQAQTLPAAVTVARIVMVIRTEQYSRIDTWLTCDTRQHDQGKYDYIDRLPDHIAAIYLE